MIDSENRQEIEREYHNRKYREDKTQRPVATVNSAYRWYQKLVDELEKGRVLDYGCGDGWMSIQLAKNGHDVFAIDISIELVKKAALWANRLQLKNIHFFEMAGEKLSFPDNYFDAVVGSAVLHHTELQIALENINRVLKPGGKGIFIEPMNQNIMLKLWRTLTPWRRSPTEKALEVKDIEKINKIFPDSKNRYFVFCSIATAGLLTVFPSSRQLNWLNDRFAGWDEKLLCKFPDLGSSCAVVVLELIKTKSNNF